MFDNVRKCPNCHADAPYGGALSEYKKCSGVYYGSCPFCVGGGMSLSAFR